MLSLSYPLMWWVECNSLWSFEIKTIILALYLELGKPWQHSNKVCTDMYSVSSIKCRVVLSQRSKHICGFLKTSKDFSRIVVLLWRSVTTQLSPAVSTWEEQNLDIMLLETNKIWTSYFLILYRHTNEDNFLAVDLAAMLDHQSIVRMLLEKGGKDSSKCMRKFNVPQDFKRNIITSIVWIKYQACSQTF